MTTIDLVRGIGLYLQRNQQSVTPSFAATRALVYSPGVLLTG
jgi:hypothetical protein